MKVNYISTYMRTHKIKKYKPLICFICICLIATLYWVLYAPYGAVEYSQIDSDIKKLSSDIEMLSNQNNAMKEEINKLQNDSQYVEDIARKDLGLLKKNELVFEFKK